jgi:hypothetical protein
MLSFPWVATMAEQNSHNGRTSAPRKYVCALNLDMFQRHGQSIGWGRQRAAVGLLEAKFA